MVKIRAKKAASPPDQEDEDGEEEVDAMDVDSGNDAPADKDDQYVSSADDDEKPSRTKKTKKRQLRPTPKASASTSTATGPRSSDHRQKLFPLYLRPCSIDRLTEEPNILSAASVQKTSNGHNDRPLLNRVFKAASQNAGPGPVWQLFEDRSWFKECCSNSTEEVTERPNVYEDLGFKVGWEELDEATAKEYLPRKFVDDKMSTPHISCWFGPFDSQRQVEIDMLDTLLMDDFFDEHDHSAVLFAGGPVWSLDWCPLTDDFMLLHSYVQYLAIAPLPTEDHNITVGRPPADPTPSCIQIWCLNDAKGKPTISCDSVLCFGFGSALHIRWCPIPSHKDEDDEFSRLGLLAGVFEDGSAYIIDVPLPPRKENDKDPPMHIRCTEPLLKIPVEDTAFLTLEWGNSNILALGCANGSIAVYGIRECIFTEPKKDAVPLYYISVHQSAIRSVSWIQYPPMKSDASFDITADPCVIMTAGYDGCLTATDLRHQASHVFTRTRDVVNSVSMSNYLGGVICSESDYIVKAYALAPHMLGKGQFILDVSGPILSFATSNFHPQLAIGSADGCCRTTNLCRAARSKLVPPFQHKIYQLDYSRNLKQYKMLERFLPTFTKSKDTHKTAITATGAWSPQVSVTCVRWCDGSGLANANLLASSTASGLCRIDWLQGRFVKDFVPYTSIEAIRGEVVLSGEDVSSEDST